MRDEPFSLKPNGGAAGRGGGRGAFGPRQPQGILDRARKKVFGFRARGGDKTAGLA